MQQPLSRKDAESNRPRPSTQSADEFLAIISHELRTPIMAILGWAELLGHNPTDPVSFAQAVEGIKRNARFEAQLVDELVEYSRVVANELPLRINMVLLASIVGTSIETLTPMALQKTIDIETKVDSSGSEMEGDPVRLQQVFLNLLSNAIKFTPVGGRIKVELENGGTHHTVRVSDTGEGISAEFLPHVFDRYRQADQTATERVGLGLGLTIAQHIVELHGGTIKADSRGKGEGAVFTVQLPRK